MENNNKKSCCHVNKGGKHSVLSHGLMMMLCCLAPILIIVALPLLGIKAGVSSSLLFLLCPLMHVFMMFGMRGHDHRHGRVHGKKQCHGEGRSYNPNYNELSQGAKDIDYKEIK